jgi:hypothetical protein
MSTIQLPADSRYKDTVIFETPDGRVVPGLLEPPPEFSADEATARRHSITEVEIGNLDLLAVKYFGPGLESLWPAIALANGITDPEFGVRAGDVLRIPPRVEAVNFTQRAGNATTA